jgi:hypothetical protein
MFSVVKCAMVTRMRDQSQPPGVCPVAQLLHRLAANSLWLFGLATLNLTSGCTSQACQPDTGVAIRYTGGTTNAAGTQYETSSWDGPWLTFPSRIRYRLPHHLRSRPIDMNIWLSLDDKPFELGEDGKRSVTPAAGNQADIVAITDQDIVVHNDTCADLFVRLTAWTTLDADAEQSSPDAAATDAAVIPDAN